MDLLLLFIKEQTIKTFEIVCLLVFYHKKSPKGNLCFKRSKLDRGYTGRAYTIQITRSLDFDGFTIWKRANGTKWVFRNKKDERGLQVKQKQDGISISEDEYVAEILKKYSYSEVKNANTSMETQKPLLKDEVEEEVDVHLYRSMIGSLMYLTSSKPDIMFAVCTCARYQVNPKVLHICVVKMIFRYLKGHPKLGLWYLKDSPFDLVAYTDSDYAGASLDRKSTTGGYQYLGCRLISWQCKKQTVVANSTTEAEYVAASSCCGKATGKAKTANREAQLHALVDGKNVILTESTIRRDLQLEDAKGVDCLPNATIFEQLTLMGSRDIGEGSAHPTDPYHTPTIIQPLTSQPQKKKKSRKTKGKDTELPQTNVPISVADEGVNEEMYDSWKGLSLLLLGGGPGYQKAMGDAAAQTREDSLKLTELMELCTNLQNRFLDLETTKTTQVMEIESLQIRVNKLKKKQMSRTHKLKRLYKVGLSARVESFTDEGLGEEDASKQGRISDIDADDDITLVSTHDKQMFDANQDLHDEEVTTTTTTPTILIDEATFAQALAELKHAKPKTKAKGIVFHEPKEFTTTTAATIPKQSSHAKIDVDYELAQRLQVEEQDELTDAEKAKLFMEFLEKKEKVLCCEK
nr:hypothetical protein [Tanacetum cinerariifolium]